MYPDANFLYILPSKRSLTIFYKGREIPLTHTETTKRRFRRKCTEIGTVLSRCNLRRRTVWC